MTDKNTTEPVSEAATLDLTFNGETFHLDLTIERQRDDLSLSVDVDQFFHALMKAGPDLTNVVAAMTYSFAQDEVVSGAHMVARAKNHSDRYSVESPDA